MRTEGDYPGVNRKRLPSWRAVRSGLEHQGATGLADLRVHAEALGLDLDRFARDLEDHAGVVRIVEDVDGADLSGWPERPPSS